MIIGFLLLTWTLIFLASRSSMSYAKKQYLYGGAVLSAAVALIASILQIMNNIN
jgi:hypothetical protein